MRFLRGCFSHRFLRLPLRHAVRSAAPEVLSLPPYSGESVPGPAARCRGSGHSAACGAGQSG